MSLLNRLERLLGRFALPHLSLTLVLAQVLFLGLALLGRFDLERIALLPAAVRAGEVWRLVTYLFIPPAGALTLTSALFLAFAWYMFYLMGSALESFWGDFRFNAFIFTGWLFNTLGAFLFPGFYASNAFIAGSVFLAFAWLNPDFELLIFFILPVKIKWLALLQWLGYGFLLATGTWPVRVMVLASIGNFLVFFAGDLVERIRGGRRRMVQQARQAALREDDEPRHRCVVCGKTDRTHPLEDFRYGDDDRCYCSEHRPSAAKPRA
jgi:hypothetical protein